MASFYLGRYNCIDLIGSGALGETYRAKIYGVAGFEKQFAVKRIHEELCSDPAFIERFVKAASGAAALGHERINPIHEVGAQGARYFVAADLARGLDVGHLLVGLKQRDEAVTPDSAVTLALDVLEALAYAHNRKDLSPNGVLCLGLTSRSVVLSPEGDAKLVDVGLFSSLAVPGWAKDDRADVLAWTAPEVADGNAADGRADVFSVGALLHLILSGTHPFAANNAAEVRKRQAAGPPPPPACEGRLQAAIQRALQPDPAARFPSVEAFSEGLRPILSARAARARGDLGMLVRRLSANPAAPTAAEPVLQDEPSKNTFAGVGPADGVPVQKLVLPGPATEKSIDSSAAIALIELKAEPPSEPGPDTSVALKLSALLMEAPKLDAPPTPEESAPALALLMQEALPYTPPQGGRTNPEPLKVTLPLLPRTEQVAAMPEAPASGRRILIVGVAVTLALAGVGIWIAVGPSSATTTPPTTTPPTTTPPTTTPPTTTPPKPVASLTTTVPSPLTTQRELPRPSPVAVKPVELSGGASVLQVTTTPPGAQLFVDGEPRGVAPLQLSLPPGTHKVVALAEQSKIKKEEVRLSGNTELALTLEPASSKPGSGSAGLKVRCKSKGELRILVDGADSGLNCPNETRINVAPGDHTIGLYSPRTDKIVEVPATVNDDEDHSTRVYLNY